LFYVFVSSGDGQTFYTVIGRHRRSRQHPSGGGQSVLEDLADSDDEEIAEAVEEAIGMAEAVSDGEDEEEAKSEWFN
jgi:hypothetical protein